MSIVTKTGDDGTTGLMYGRRVPKSHPRVEAYGAADELNSALGFARATAEEASVRETLFRIQKDLVVLMGELATAKEDLDRYVKDGYSLVVPALTSVLEAGIREIESQNVSFKGWATPGATVHSAALDLARSVCRRTERLVCALQEQGEIANPEILIYLNRLADFLWLAARRAESKASAK